MFRGCRPTYRKQSEVLDNISQEQIFYEYLGIYPDLSQRFKSPFRANDKNPGCRFTWYSGILYFVENTMFNNKLYWSCIDIVMYVKHCNFQEALDLLWQKSSPTKIKTISVDKVFVPEIRFEKQSWEENNLLMLHGDILEKELVFRVKNYWIKTKAGWNRNSIHDPNKTLVIAYFFPITNHVKLYFPNETENKWYSNCTISDIFGEHKLEYYRTISEKLIITKSGKDRLMLDYFIGVPSIALQNEGCYFPEDIPLKLSTYFKDISFLYDNDMSGILQAQKLSEKYGYSYKIIECDAKDPYEMIQTYGIENTKKLIL